MKVSVVIPTYNSSDYIVETVKSVLAQTWKEIEILIIDDCSSDNTLEKVNREFGNVDKVIIERLESNSGAAVARNRGISLSSGRYIAFLDADDTWLPNKVESQITFMNKNECAFAFALYNVIDEAGMEVSQYQGANKGVYKFHDLLLENVILTSSVIIDTETIGKIEMPLIRRRQDFAYWLKILKLGFEAHCLRDYLVNYRVHSKSLSANKLKSVNYTWKVYRATDGLNLFSSVYYFLNYLVRTTIKRLKR